MKDNTQNTAATELPAWSAPTLSELHVATSTLAMSLTDADAGNSADMEADS